MFVDPLHGLARHRKKSLQCGASGGRNEERLTPISAVRWEVAGPARN